MTRLLGGVGLVVILGASSLIRADDDDFSLPLTTPAATSSPYQQGPSAGPAQASPAGQSQYPAADRWTRRSLQMREASTQGTIAQPKQTTWPAQPPMEIGPEAPPSPTASFSGTFAPSANLPPQDPARQYLGSQQHGPQYSGPQYAPPAYPSPGITQTANLPPGMTGYTQQPTSPAEMPGGTRFRAKSTEAAPEIGVPPSPEQKKRPSQLPKVTQILPYADYEPDPRIAKENPCENQCPTPDGKPCKTKDGRTLDCPEEIQLSEGPFQPRVYEPKLFAWQASNICYQPLYFEDPQLERYGHAWPFFIQPIASSLRFTLQAAGLPYQMTIDRPCSDVYPLGYYRPGECAPKQIPQIPLNLEAALVEAGAVTGVYFLFPHSAWQ